MAGARRAYTNVMVVDFANLQHAADRKAEAERARFRKGTVRYGVPLIRARSPRVYNEPTVQRANANPMRNYGSLHENKQVGARAAA